MRRFDACGLCLNRAREPLACSEGHLFCKECVYTDLRTFLVARRRRRGFLTIQTAVTQKKDIKRQKDRLEALKKEVEEERTRARQAARERVLRDFERGQLRLGTSSFETVEESSKANDTERKFFFFFFFCSFPTHKRRF